MTERSERFEWHEVATFKARKLYEHVTAEDAERIPWGDMTPGERLDWIEVAVSASGLTRQMGTVAGIMRGVHDELKGLGFAFRKFARGEYQRNPGEME